jgi:hypothetical protein
MTIHLYQVTVIVLWVAFMYASYVAFKALAIIKALCADLAHVLKDKP